MEIFQIVSILIIPVLMLATPIIIFSQKNRNDIALMYMGTMAIMQILLIVYRQPTLSGEPNVAFTGAIGLIGLSLFLGAVFSGYKLKNSRWYGYSFLTVAITALFMTLSHTL